MCPGDHPTIQTAIYAAFVGDTIAVENYESETGCNMQLLINGKAIEILSEESYLDDHPSNKKKARALLHLTAKRPASRKPKVSNEQDGSCPFPPVPLDITPTLVERQSGSEKANFYVWAADGKLYVNIDPLTSGFEIISWAYDKFYLGQDGYHREIYLVDCLGQMYDDEIAVFTAQTFEMQDGPDWTGPTFDPSRILTLGFTTMNGDNYSWDVGSGIPIVIPPVPPGVAGTLVERQKGSEKANFYVWAADGKLYVNIDPLTSGFEIISWAYDKFYLAQDGYHREVYLIDCLGQMCDNEIAVFTAQTFEMQDGPDWTGPTFDRRRILTLGFTAMNGDNYSWDVGSGIPTVIPPVPPGVTGTLVERQFGSEQANFYVWASGGKLYVNINPVTTGFEIYMAAFDKFSVTQDGIQREVILKDCIGQIYDRQIVVFTSQTFELKEPEDWTGPCV